MIWEDWFAWHPVKTNAGYRWLRPVLRQRTMEAVKIGNWNYKITYSWRYLA